MADNDEEEHYGLLWVPHEKSVFALSEFVAKTASGKLVVETNPQDPNAANRERMEVPVDHVFHVEEIHLQNAVKDICHLFADVAHPAPTLYYFRKSLFNRGLVYVNASNAMFSVNPYQPRPRLYSDENIAKYVEASHEDLSELPPHVYGFAKKVFHEMLEASATTSAPDMLNQAIVCSGISGSGKTENAKYISAFVVKASQAELVNAPDSSDLKEAQNRAVALESILGYSNTVFETFGNSKTVLNDNASRFSKQVKLQFTKKNQLVSIYTETSMLEKSRLTQVIEGERNYHIFYQLFRGMGSAYPALKKSLQLNDVNDFRMLTSGNCLTMKNVHQDVGGFHATVKALKALGSTEDELEALWTLIAVMLHLGNADVYEPGTYVPDDSSDDDNDGDASEGGASTPKKDDKSTGPCQIVIDTLNVNEVAMLLGVESNDFTAMLTTKESVYYSAERVQVNIHGFLKHIYKGIYFWIVRKVNHQGAYFGKLMSDPVKFIGVLDVAGSEDKGVEGNSLEQLLINLTNERLKGHFNDSTFRSDEKLYQGENVPCEFISYTSNDCVVDFLVGKNGLMPVLDAQTQVANVGTESLLQSLVVSSKNFPEASANDETSIFQVVSENAFRVEHFTGNVVYCVDEFMSKNLESTGVDYGVILNSSTNTFLQATLGIGSSVKDGETGHIPWLNNPLVMPKTMATLKTKSISGNNTVWGQYSGQLETLISSIGGCNCHFMKCIRPSHTDSPDEFDPAFVLTQIERQGLMDIANMIKEGLPERMKFKEFYIRYEVLKAAEHWPAAKACSESISKQYAAEIAASLLTPSAYAVGTSMIFLRDGCSEFLDHNVDVFYDANATLIQSHFRRHKAVAEYSVNIEKHRKKKAAAELSKSILGENGGGPSAMNATRKNSVHAHNVQYDVFSAINIMQSKGRRSTSPSISPGGVSPHTLPSILFGHVDEDTEGEDEDSKQIRRLHEYYLSRMELIKTFIRNVLVRRRTNAMFDAVRTGDQDKIMIMLRKRPELINVLDKENDFCTLQHAALQTGDMDMCKLLGLSPLSLMVRDAGDHSCIHYAALTPALASFKLFYKTISTMLGIPKYTFVEAPATPAARPAKDSSSTKSKNKKDKSGSSPADGDAAGSSGKNRMFSRGSDESFKSPISSNFKSPLSSGAKGEGKDAEDRDSTINTKVFRMGVMFKINMSGRMAKRLFVLKDNRLRYYPITKLVRPAVITAVNQASNIKESKAAFSNIQLPEYFTDEFVVTQQDCFFSRYNYKGKEDLSIVLNFAQASTKKRRTRLIIKANNEREVQQWMLNLSQIASFDRFRAYAPRFRNPLFCRTFLSQVTWAKETALHTLVHSAGSLLRKAKVEAYAINPEHPVDESGLLFNHMTCCAWLIDHGCPVNFKNYEGQTALHIAVESANYSMVATLTVKGAMVDIKDFNAKTPLDLCDTVNPVDLGYDLEDAQKVILDAEARDAEKAKKAAAAGGAMSISGLDALDASVSMKKLDAEEQKRLEEEEIIEQKFAEKRMACEDLIDFAMSQASLVGRNMKHIMRQEAREYHRLQVPINNKTRLLPSPLTPNMALRNPYQSPHSQLMPPQKKGYSYMAIHLQRQGIELNSSKGAPHSIPDQQNFALVAHSSHLVIQMGLYNGTTNGLVEPMQELEKPVYRDSSGNFVWWGANYYIQTPLEFIPDSCYLTFRFFLKSTNPAQYERKGGKVSSSRAPTMHNDHDSVKDSDRGADSDESDDDDSNSNASDGAGAFKQMFNDRPVELTDIDIARGTLVIDKATIDSGTVKLTMRDHRDSSRLFNSGGGLKDEGEGENEEKYTGYIADKVVSSPFASLGAYVSGGSLKSILELDIEICEYFEPISLKDVLVGKVDNIHAYTPGSYHNNPPHLLGASHDKTMNKTKKGVMKTIPELFALSYFEGGSSERFHITLPVHANGGDLIRNIGGHAHIDVRVPGHIRGGQNVVVVVPKYWTGAVPDSTPEVYADDFNKNLNNAERLQYQLPSGVTEGPYVVQNVDGSRIVSFKVTRSMVQKCAANGDNGLSIIIVLNSWINEIDLFKSTQAATASGKKAPGTSLFSAFLDNPSAGGGKSKGGGDGEDFSYDQTYGSSSGDSFAGSNPMKSRA
jgi:ankyrin repeat protein